MTYSESGAEQGKGDPGNCLESALGLREDSHGGQVYWVANAVDGNGNLTNVEHAYFVPDGASGESRALNQSDQGFNNYPAYTVEEVRSLGLQAEFDSQGNIVGFADKK